MKKLLLFLVLLFQMAVTTGYSQSTDPSSKKIVGTWYADANRNTRWVFTTDGKVFNYEELDNQPFVNELQLKQTVKNAEGETLVTTRSPIQLDGEILVSEKAAPKVGQDNFKIHEQFLNA